MTQREDPTTHLEGYTTVEKLPRQGFLWQSTTYDSSTKQKNAELIQSYQKALDSLLGVQFAKKFLSIVSFQYPEQKNYESGEDILDDESLERAINGTQKLIDIADRLKSFPYLIQLPSPDSIPESDLQELEERLDLRNYSTIILANEEQGLYEEAEKLKKVEQHKEEENSRKILEFMASRGYPKQVLLPRFLETIQPDNLVDLDFPTISQKILREADKIRIARHVLVKKKPFDSIRVKDYNRHTDLAHAIHERGIPFDMLGETALQVLLGQLPLTPDHAAMLQASLNEVIHMSRDLRFVLSEEPLDFVALKKWVHIPKGFFSGSEYKMLARFQVAEFRQFLENSTWVTLASFNKYDSTLQFYTPEASPTFLLKHSTVELGLDIQGITNRLVQSDDVNLDPDEIPSNYEMMKKLQQCFLGYFMMKELSKLLGTSTQMSQSRQEHNTKTTQMADSESHALLPNTNNNNNTTTTTMTCSDLPAPLEEAPLPPPLDERGEGAFDLPSPPPLMDLPSPVPPLRNSANLNFPTETPSAPPPPNDLHRATPHTSPSFQEDKDLNTSSVLTPSGFSASDLNTSRGQLKPVKQQRREKGTTTDDLMSIISRTLDRKFHRAKNNDTIMTSQELEADDWND